LADFIKEDLEAGETEDVYDHLDTMQGRVKRLENLINDILRYSKIGKIMPETVDLNSMIKADAKTTKTPQLFLPPKEYYQKLQEIKCKSRR